MSLRDLYDRYSDRIQFLMVYIREAHPTDGRRPSREVRIEQHKTLDDRTKESMP